ncbi:MAG: hypothetical protein Q9192_001512 [Flavoplaca navasiana]
MPPKRISGGPTAVIKGPAFSDGDATHRPEGGNLTRANEDGYLQFLAEKWMKEEVGGAQPDVNGFCGLGVRESPISFIDRWLYGHPDGKRFDSPNRFYPHFKYLMQHGNGEPCKCDMCGTKGRKPGPKKHVGPPPAATKRQTRPTPLTRGPVDEEGTPDVFCSLFTLLKSEGTLSRVIEERASLDWRAERPLVRRHANSIPKQPAFIPRTGEIVLYLRPLPPGVQLRQDPQTHQFSLHDTINNRPAGIPKWVAGVVTQVPSTAPTTASLYPPPDESSDGPPLNQTGFRIEPLPSPNSSDKNLSKQHTYTPLYLIRPFAFWQHLLAGIPESEWHISIHNALTASATVSLMDRQRFSGKWPSASIHSSGLFVGAECYWVGDVVRLLSSASSHSLTTATTAPDDDENPILIMKIQKIITKFHTLSPEPSIPSIITGNRCHKITLSIQGPVYTSSHTTSSSHIRIPGTHLSKAMQSYNTEWFHLDQPDDIHSASFSSIHSRFYEADAISAYLPSLPASDLLHAPNTTTHNNESTPKPHDPITQARTIAAASDERITDTDSPHPANQSKSFLWADSRSEALDLQTVNGLEVGLYDMEREPRVWREVLGVVDGRREGVDVGVLGGRRIDGVGRGSEDEEGEEGEGEEEEEEEESDEVMEIDAPETKSVGVEVKVPVRG